MAEQSKTHPIIKVLKILSLDKKDISSIYLYAVIAGILQLSLPLGIQSIINFITFNAVSTSLILLIIFVITGVFLTSFLQIKQMQLTEKIQQKIFVRYSFSFADNIPKIAFSATEDYYLPELSNRFFDVLNLQKGISKLLLDIPPAFIQILFGITLLSFYHSIFIALGGLLLLIVYLIIRLTSNKGLETSMLESDYKYKVAAWIQEISRNINLFKNRGQEQLNIRQTDKYVEKYLYYRTKHFLILSTQYWTLAIFKLLLMASMLIIGCVLLINQLINIGQFIAAELVIIMIMNSIEKLIKNIDTIFDVLTAVEKLNKVLLKPKDIDGNLMLKSENEGLSIVLKNIGFGYTPNSKIFHQLSVSLEKSEKTLIISKQSGSGASTFLKLLSGGYTPSEGTILINDVLMSNLEAQSYRKKVSYLSGEQEIFHASLWDNLTVGNDTASVESIVELTKKLGFDDFVTAFEQGFDSQLFTKGQKLPSHLIKKILLLRTFLKPCQLLLLDEPFKHLSENQQEKLIKHIKQSNATVIIATQNTTWQNAFDKIVELD
jgi:ATP-binding cassette, subfamily B, bacterial